VMSCGTHILHPGAGMQITTKSKISPLSNQAQIFG
jgi:hypothetical protein